MPRAKDVDRWFASYDNPMKPVVMRMRDIILGADPRIAECIKWQAPTFTYEGNLASFFPKSKQHASLMFHDGASIPGRWTRLEGDSAKGRLMKITSLADADAARGELERIVVAWCDSREAKPAKAKPAKTKPAKAAKAKPAKRRR